MGKSKLYPSVRLLCIGFWLLTGAAAVQKSSPLEEKLKNDSDLSEFYSLIEADEIAQIAIRLRGLTIFAPTNDVFQRYKDITPSVLYYFTTVNAPHEQLQSPISSDMDGNPFLYITRFNKTTYVNNAKIVNSKSNQEFTNEKGLKQYLHIIDDLLIPIKQNPNSKSDNLQLNMDAFQFLTHSESLDIGTHRVRTYRRRVILSHKENIYQDLRGFHTFFIPVEEGFKPQVRTTLVDNKVIDGHVIPHKVLFTAAAKMDPEAYPTMAFEDNLKVTISFFTQTEGKTTKMYVKSNTLIGDSTHAAGAVLAEVVRANIPVKNGVVHLIQRPLIVVDTTVKQFLENFKEKEDEPLFKFYRIILDHGGQFIDRLNSLGDVTLFAPSNAAWDNPNLVKVLTDPAKMQEILDLHVVRGRYNIEKIRTNYKNNDFQVPTLVDRKMLFFNIHDQPDRNQTVTVEGGGVNATILQADIAATNGYVHIIDHVLGAPYSTVLEKLKKDPMMRSTYTLGDRSEFNLELNNTKTKFTYFVPSDYAWQQTELIFPSAHKKLFMMHDYDYHAKNVLERHLVIADRIFTMADLKAMGREYVLLPSMRDNLKLRIKEEKYYSVQWNHQWIQVIRPDVECTNGIIHVIDRPFLDDSDVTVTRAAANVVQATLSLAFIVKIIISFLI